LSEGVRDDAVVGPATTLFASGESGVDEEFHVVRDGGPGEADRFGVLNRYGFLGSRRDWAQ
jgi:hypothetical protein